MVPLLKRSVWLKILYIQKSEELLCLLRKHKHCQVGTIYQFLTINQSRIQITESIKSLSPQFWRYLSRSVNKGLGNQSKVPSIQQNWNLVEQLLPKMSGRAGPIWSCPKKPPQPSF